MDETIEERIKRIEDMDITEIPYLELSQIINDVNSDLKFVEYKKRYYSEFVNKLQRIKLRLRTKIFDIKDNCAICNIKSTTDKLRTLPDCRRVCKKCWTIEVCVLKLKNANNIMNGCADPPQPGAICSPK